MRDVCANYKSARIPLLCEICAKPYTLHFPAHHDLFDAFDVSGIRLASGKQMDWFGAYIIGKVTAIGGGTLRDLLLDVTPFWMLDAKYFLTTWVSLLHCFKVIL